jgi:hypothetical protein
LATKIVIERRALGGSGIDGLLQLIATVFIDGDEYRVMAPWKAVGDSLDWLEHALVRVPIQHPFDRSITEIDAEESTRIDVTRLVKDELERLRHEMNCDIEFIPGEPYFHVLVHTLKEPKIEAKFDLRRNELELRILEPYKNLRPIVVGGRTIPVGDLVRVAIFESERSTDQFNEWSVSNARAGVPEWFEGEPDVREISDDLITTPSVAHLPQSGDAVELLCLRFHAVAKQLRERRENRATLDVVDEYDVQDLLHALLWVFFDDIRKEAWTPSYAGRSSRVDFLLPIEQVVIETKKTRVGLGARELGDELLIDIAHYKEFQLCKRLICFVYDPDGRVVNPRGLERDLSRKEPGFEAKTFVVPRNYCEWTCQYPGGWPTP